MAETARLGSPYVGELYVRTDEGWRCAFSQKTPVSE